VGVGVSEGVSVGEAVGCGEGVTDGLGEGVMGEGVAGTALGAIFCAVQAESRLAAKMAVRTQKQRGLGIEEPFTNLILPGRG
jgi:hypothetical protein